MRRNFYIILLFFIGLQYITAQVTFVDDSIVVNKTINDNVHLEFQFKNTGNTTESVYWEIQKMTFNPEWSSQVCVGDICFAYNKDKASKDIKVKSNETVTMSLGINHNKKAAQALIIVKLYSDKEFTKVLDSLPIFVNVLGTSAAKNIKSKADILIYPNPATDYFYIDTNKEIKKIDMFNLIGKKVRTLVNRGSNVYNISDMRKGIYLLRIFDKNNRVLRVARLSINDRQP